MGLEFWPCYHSYRKKCEKLTDQELGRLVRSLMIFSETGERQELAGRESIAFDFIADDIDRARKSYENKCSANKRNIEKRYKSNTEDTNVYDRIRPNTEDTNVYDRIRPYTEDTNVYEIYQSKSESEDKSESKRENNLPVPEARAREDPELGRVMRFFFDRINTTPSPTCLDMLKQFTASLSADVVIHACEIALDERKTSWSYIRAILAQYERDGIRSMDDIKRREDERERQRESAQQPARRMSKSEEIANMGRGNHQNPKTLQQLVDDLDKI